MGAELILATASPYKQSQLSRLGLKFKCIAPDIDETPLPHERAEALAIRLAREKCQKVAAGRTEALVLACDQSAELNGTLLDKPGDDARALQQLRNCSGQRAVFYSAIALYRPNFPQISIAVTPTTVHFRALSDREIASYIKKEDALDCAGGFKIEALGITLFESISSTDPTALEGLPLIEVCRLLREAGFDPLLNGAN